ncbi:MAG: restriction endonuclease [Sphingomonadales bacterium]|nr:restriction endonuclease [Sphingomonadales bacterium]
MGRKRKQALTDNTNLLKLGAGVFLAWFVISIITSNPLSFLATVLLCGGLIYLLHKNKMQNRLEERQQFENALESAISSHKDALLSYYRQDRSTDQFGNIDDTKWQNRVNTFLRTQVLSNSEHYASWRSSEFGRYAADYVNHRTEMMERNTTSRMPVRLIDETKLSPIDYEHYCASFLKSDGWDVKVTQASCDGGADFIATKNQIRIVAQCKRYAKPVGNGAVQEVSSARHLYNGNVACVIAPNGFTKQAQFEAESQAVHLIHHLDLEAWSRKLLY